MEPKRSIFHSLPLVAAASLIIGLLMGVALKSNRGGNPAINKINEIFEIIGENYVDNVDFDSLVERTLPEMLRNLDPHSAYIPASERIAASRELEGSFYGIGIQFQMMNDTLYILEVISGGASEKAGILPGDRLVEVDGENIAGVGVSEDRIFSLLRGQKDTPVQVKILRHNSPKLLTFDLIRGEVPVSPIDASYIINDSIGYIRLGKFSENTYYKVQRNRQDNADGGFFQQEQQRAVHPAAGEGNQTEDQGQQTDHRVIDVMIDFDFSDPHTFSLLFLPRKPVGLTSRMMISTENSMASV